MKYDMSSDNHDILVEIDEIEIDRKEEYTTIDVEIKENTSLDVIL